MAFGRSRNADADESGKADANEVQGAPQAYLDRASVVSGDLRFAENVLIEGQVEGQIRAAKSVVIAEGAAIDASIEAEMLEVRGSVTGDIRVSRRTVLHKSARVEGEIHSCGIVVEEGAHFRGCIVIEPEPRSTSAAALESGSNGPTGSEKGDPHAGASAGARAGGDESHDSKRVD